MKVALFVHCFYPRHFYGTETYTLELAHRLQEMGHDVHVVAATFEGEPKQEQPIDAYEYQGIPVVSIDKNAFGHHGLGETYYQPAMRPVLRRVLLDLRPDVVHVTHLINHTATLLDEVRAQEVPMVGTLTDFFGFCYTNTLEAADGSLCGGPSPSRSNCVACWLKESRKQEGVGLVRRAATSPPVLGVAAAGLVRAARLPGVGAIALGQSVRALVERPDVLGRAYEAFDAVITPTRFLRDAYERNGLRAPAHEIRFGVDLPRDPKPRRATSDPLRIGYIGQLASHKGVDLLVDAFASLGPTNAELHVFGPEDQDGEYMARLRRSADGRAVSFRGTFPKEQMADVLGELDLLAIPSRWYENSPLVLLNALASHTPVLISDVAGMIEFVEPGANGLVFARGDSADLSRTLRRMVAAPDAIRAMAATTEYPRTTMAMANDTVQVYQQLTGPTSDRAAPQPGGE